MKRFISSRITFALLVLILAAAAGIAPRAAQANGPRPATRWYSAEAVTFGPRSLTRGLHTSPALMARAAVARSMTVSSEQQLALAPSAFPAGSVLVDSGAMTAQDADRSALAGFHSKSCANLGMMGGWFQYYTQRLPDQGLFEAVYLGSYYSSSVAARAAFADVANGMDASGQALPCSGGERCGEAPITIVFDDGPYVGLYRVVQRSNALMEAVSVVPRSDYDAMQPNVEKAVDGVTAGFLALSSTASSTDTPVPPPPTVTATPVPTKAAPTIPTSTATSVRPTKSKPPKSKSKRCKKGYKLIRGKCRKHR